MKTSLFIFLLCSCIITQEEIDYSKLPNKYIKHREVSKFIELINSEYEFEGNASYHFYRYKNGIEIHCTSKDTIMAIIYPKEKLDKNVQLPYNIERNDLLKDIELKIGKPDFFCTYHNISKAFYFSKNLMVFYQTNSYKKKDAVATSFNIEQVNEQKIRNSYYCIPCRND